ncbi:WD40-repeat-containing domain protein [Penicillium lividum]|nr:WD40-repeat-containing domain protein [Penicillium lividum]
MESPKWVIMKSAPEYDWNLCLQTFEGYNTCVAWSHARNRLASAYPDGTINIWDPNTGQRVFNLTGHNESFTRTAMKESGYLGGSYTIQDLAWSPDGTRLASLGHDNIIKVWDSDTQQCISTLQEDANRIESFAWSYDGSRIAIVLLGYPSGKVKIWDPNTAQCMSILKHGRSTLESVAWSPDGRQLASSLWDSTVSIWNPLTSQCISTLGRVDDSGIKTFYSTEWSYDGSRLAIGYSDFVEIWNPQTGQPVLTFKGPPVDNATKRKIRITWSKDGTRLAVSLSTPSVIIWNSVTGQHISTLEGHENYVSAIAWSHVGSRLASGSEDCTIRIWNPVTAQCVSILRGHFGDTFALFWSRNGSQIISASADGAIKIWDPSTDHNLSTPDGHSDQIRSIAWSYDGRKLASVSNYMTVKIWDKYTGKCISTLEELHPHVTDIPVCISWSRHSTSLLSVILGKLRVWDPLTGQCISTLDHTSLIDFCVWSDEGTLVASSSRDAISSIIIIWNPFTNERLWVFKGHSVPVRTLAWSHCGTMLASAANLGGWSIRPLSEIMIWSLYTGQPLLSHRVDFKVSVMSWSNDDTRIVAGGQGIMIFDLTDGTFTINDAKVHGKEISCITWSRDGIKVASMSPDKKVYIWYLDGTGQIKGTKIGLCGWARFDEVDSNLLYTDTGILNLQHYLPDPSIPPTWERVGYGLKHDSCWITFEGKDLLWLPPEYRPVNSSLTAISGTTVAIGCSSGRVLILEFSELPKDLFAWS